MTATKTATTIDVNTVGPQLQDSLVELIDLALQAKQAHWNVTGSHFRPVHLHLDELTAEVRKASDEVAERASAIGYSPDGRASTVAKNSPLDDFPEGPVPDGEVARMISDRLAIVAERMRARCEGLDEADKVSQDILLGVLAMLDKHHWMFEAETER